jgi:hypothetical protein
MSNSSQPTTLSQDLLDDIMITAGGAGLCASDTITISNSYNYNTTCDYGTITLTSGSVGIGTSMAGGTYTIGSGISSIDLNSNYTINYPEEWVNSFPDWDRVENMCKHYPGLEIALKNFRLIYELVKDDYDNPTPKK